MRSLVAATVGTALLLAAGSARADAASRPPPGTFKPIDKSQQQQVAPMEAAANVEGSLPGTIGLSHGEKRSFKADCKGAFAVDSAVVQLRVDAKGVLTVRGLKSGETIITLIGKAGKAPPSTADYKATPKTVKVKVTD
jgi:hypothetical protein